MPGEINQNTTFRPQPITATKPHQFLPTPKEGKYPTVHEIDRAQALLNAALQNKSIDGSGAISPIPPKMIQSPNDAGSSFSNILVKAMESIALQDKMESHKIKMIDNTAANVQIDLYFLNRLLNNKKLPHNPAAQKSY